MRLRLALLSLAACSATQPQPHADAPPPTPHVTPTATATVALDPGPPVATPSPPPPPEPLKEGYFTCTDTQCKSYEETCCESDSKCIPRRDEPPADECYVRKDCDTSRDCFDGQRCCIHGYAISLPYYSRRCEARCREAEACSEGTCPAGQVCWGTCANPNVEVQCGDTLCRGEQPFCRWDATRKAGSCVAPGAASMGVFTCDDDHDCLPDERCWLGISGSSWCCRGESCFDHAATTKFVACKTDRDCHLLKDMKFECVADDTLLPHLHGHCNPIHDPK
jgi:hypothetical protein